MLCCFFPISSLHAMGIVFMGTVDQHKPLLSRFTPTCFRSPHPMVHQGVSPRAHPLSERHTRSRDIPDAHPEGVTRKGQVEGRPQQQGSSLPLLRLTHAAQTV
jgi:hypothetical protein